MYTLNNIQCVDKNIDHNSSSEPNTYIKLWEESKTRDFIANIDNNQIKIIYENLCKMENDSIIQSEINEIVDTISSIFVESAKKSFGCSRPKIFKTDNDSSQPKWFGFECKQARKQFHRAKYQFKLRRSDANRLNVKKQSKHYKSTIHKHYKQSLDKNIAKLKKLEKSNPRQYWKIINGKRTRETDAELSDLYEHFKNVNTDTSSEETNESQIFDHIESNEMNEYINADISIEEIELTINKLKNNKSSGVDRILNEHIKATYPMFKDIYFKLFNIILKSGLYPESWSTGIIKPIFKNKGSPSDASNYRPITLLSCLSKLFTAIINNRLQSYIEEFHILNENQSGFRKGYSTLDNMFVLQSLIQLLSFKRKKLFCAFIDLKQAFDKIPRAPLWSKLLKCNVNGKCFTLIKNMYKNIKSCVSVNNTCSDFFTCDMGVRQGENLSPLLFSLYLNDLEEYLINSNIVEGIKCHQYISDDSLLIYLKLFILLYADDTIIVSDTAEDLQNALNTYSSYCERWGLKVNTDKTKIVIFSKGRTVKYKFTYENKEIEILKEYKYLGIFFSKSGSYLYAKKHIAKQGTRALYSLLKKAKHMCLPIDLQISLFNTLIKPILLYGCEIWGFGNLEIIDRVQLKFLKYILNVKKSTPTCMVYGETGVLPISIDIHTRMVSYWTKLIQTENYKLSSIFYTLVHSQYNHNNSICNKKKLPWIDCINNILIKTGQSGFWDFQNVCNPKWFTITINQRLKDLFLNDWYSTVNSSTVCYNYRLFKTTFGFEKYLVSTPNKYLNSLINFRIRNHKLPIETGKWKKIQPQNRICNLCEQEIGDEYHYIFTCREFSTLRKTFIKQKYTTRPNILNYQNLINTKSSAERRKLSLFIKEIFKRFK